MSGLEIAGVVLGALPLIISALEHYAEGVRTAKRFWQYKSELRSLILQVRTEREIFVNTLERLLIGIICIERIAKYISHPAGELWRDPYSDAKLQRRLRGSYEVYIDNIRGMNASLRKMMDRLALDSEGKPQFTDIGIFKQEYKRLKFSLSKSDYASHITDLRGYNHALSQLTQQSLSLESARNPRNRGFHPNFKALHARAKDLHVSLRSRLTCEGGCRGHAIKLRLESRIDDGLAEESHTPSHNSFRIIFVHSSNFSWEEAEVQYTEDEPQTVPLRRRDLNVPDRLQQSATQSSRLSTQSQSSRTATLTVTERHIVSVATSMAPLSDLCKVIQQLQQAQAGTCVGFFEDTSKRKQSVYAVAVLDKQEEWTAYSLRQILTQEVRLCRLTTNHKLRIAVDLASSILQLYKTPWLDENWSKADVYFVRRPGSPPSKVYEHPYVHNTIPTTSGPSSIQSHQVQHTRYQVIRNQTLYNLGILLIEIWYGYPIEKLQVPNDLDCAGTPGVVWCTAARLVEKELKFEAGKQYSDAVRRCIHCDFDRSNMDLDDELFRQTVFDKVVVPLHTTLQQFSGEVI